MISGEVVDALYEAAGIDPRENRVRGFSTNARDQTITFEVYSHDPLGERFYAKSDGEIATHFITVPVRWRW